MSTEKIRQALNIAWAAAEGQVNTNQVNEDWRQIVREADREMAAIHRERIKA